MDILNFIYLKTANLIRSKANNADTDLIAVGANVGPVQRGDSYQTYAMPIKDLVESGCEANTVHYELDITQTSLVTVTTPRGIIDIDMDGTTVKNAEVFNFIKDNLNFDQLIWEFGTDSNPDWVHVSYESTGKQRKQILKAVKSGKGTSYVPYK